MKTEQELKEIKTSLAASYTPIYTIEVPLDEDELEYATIFLKKYDRIVLSALQKLVTGPDPLKAIEFYIKNCYLGGDDINLILNNLDALRACEGVVVDMITAKKAKLSKN